ncbi:sensor histidine kinase [Lachnospiraceae bacterium 62-26]
MRTAVVFLKEKKNEIVLYAVLVGTFSVVSYLYDIRMDAVEYALLLSVVWLLLSGIWEYLIFAGKHKRLLEAERSLNLNGRELDIDSALPGADTLIEKDYQRIIMRLYEAGSEAESAGRIARQEMMDYYGMWVHQIKTPIAAMHVLLQAASESQVEDERTAGEHWKDKEMKLELFKIEQYVEMVLTYLRMEDMSSDMSFEICELDSVIRQAVRKYSQMFILRKIKLDYVPVETKILTDEKWLVFVVEQILSNALKYTHSYSVNERSCSMEVADMNVEQGRISIYMEEYEPAQHGSGVDITESYGAVSRGKKRCLVIEDTGIGICPEDLPRVFEKGFTGYNGRKDKKSTGIGLYLCKAVMDKLRHQIWIESEAGEGTKVYLSLARENMRHE